MLWDPPHNANWKHLWSDGGESDREMWHAGMRVCRLTNISTSCWLAFSLTSYLTFWCCWTSNWDLIHVTLAVEDANKFFLQISEDNAWCHLNIVTLFYCPYRFHRLLCCHPSLQASSLSGSLGCFENAKVFTFLMGLIGPLCTFLNGTSKSMHKAAFLNNQFVILFLNLCYFLANPAFLLWP